MKTYLIHHGILGQRWGRQNGPPYPLNASDMSSEERKRNKIDVRWVKKNDRKIRKYAESQNKEELKLYARELSKVVKKYTTTGKISKTYANAYNRKMVELMNKSIESLEAPSGRIVRFVAKRGEIGVYTALADKDYDLNQITSGIYNNGRVAYKKKNLDMVGD